MPLSHHMLAHYLFDRHHEDVNTRDTLRAVPAEAESVRRELRTPMDVQGGAAAPAEPWLPSAPADFSLPPQMDIAGENSGLPQGAAGGAAGAADVAGAAGATAPTARPRSAQMCRTCGHKMRVGPFKRYHTQFLSAAGGSSCTVPHDLRRPVVQASGSRPIRIFGSMCACSGDEDHPGGCSSVAWSDAHQQ